jgi:TRAP-type C4-dicarboxylate transport system substrate-binding protein
MNWDQAQAAFQQHMVDGQENPVALIIPYKFWSVHSYVTLWHYAIDPLILAVSAKTWATLSAEDQNTLQKAGESNGGDPPLTCGYRGVSRQDQNCLR